MKREFASHSFTNVCEFEALIIFYLNAVDQDIELMLLSLGQSHQVLDFTMAGNSENKGVFSTTKGMSI